jgi:hypothetical protein
MAWYKTGTISVTNGSTTVTGSGTSWSANVAAGDTLKVGAAIYEITAVASNTSLTIGENFADSTASGLSYSIAPTSLAWSLGVSGDAADLAGMADVGIAVRVSDGAFSARAIAVSGEGLQISNGDGVSANPTVTLDDDLAAIEALSSPGFAARTGTNTWAARTITGTADEIEVTDGDGASDDPVISFPASVNFGTRDVIVSDTGFEIRDDTDVTRIVKFQVSGITPGETRTFSFPNGDGTFALAADVQPVSDLLTDIAALGASMDAGSLLLGAGANNMAELPIGPVGAFLRVLSGGLAWDDTLFGGALVLRDFTTSGDYVPTTNMIAVLMIATGAGPGGGGVNIGATAHIAVSGGGGSAGSTVFHIFTADDIGASKYVNIGSPGGGGVGAANGADGGHTGLGTGLGDYSLLKADGGKGGAFAERTTTGIAVGAGGAAVLATTGLIKVYGARGGQGAASYALDVAQYGAQSGKGAGSWWGDGGPSVWASGTITNGSNGVAPGSAGSGAAGARNTTGTGTGGTGAAGRLIAIELVGA